MKTNWLRVTIVCVTAYLILVAVVARSGMRSTGGHFVYAVSSAYTHLSAAQQMAHGHVGVNALQTASADASLLWPALLSLFAGTSAFVLMPLVLNLIFGIVCCALIATFVVRWQSPPNDRSGLRFGKQVVTSLLLLGCANVVGLTLTGMEAVLEIDLAIACAMGLVEALRDRPIPWWCLLAAVLGPAVRYELLMMTFAIACALTARRRIRTAAAVSTLSVLPLAGFAVFFRHHALPRLPMAVRSGFEGYMRPMLSLGLRRGGWSLLQSSLLEQERLSVTLLTVILAVLAWQSKTGPRRAILAAAALAGAVQAVAGPVGGWFRLEVYALVFLLLVALVATNSDRPLPFSYLVFVLAACGLSFGNAIFYTPEAMLEIYSQPSQVGRFATEFYGGNYAVGSLGAESFHPQPAAYVLDLKGLGSPEIIRHADPVREQQIHFDVVPDYWFATPPTGWVPVARQCYLGAVTVVLSSRCLIYFSTDAAHVAGLREAAEHFAPSLPKFSTMELNANSAGPALWTPAGRTGQ